MIATRLQSNVQCNQNQQSIPYMIRKVASLFQKLKFSFKTELSGIHAIGFFVYKFPGNGLLFPKFIQTKSGLSGNQSGKSQRPHQPDLQTVTSPTAQTRTALITDRKIYRPGQTVYYKGISWSTSPDTLYALENRKYKISFKDANDKEIAQQEVTSNRYGSFTGVSSFQPASLTDILPSIPKKVRLPSRLRITNALNSKSSFKNRQGVILPVT